MEGGAMTNETNKPLQCWSCKATVAPTDIFCPHCGTKVRGSSAGPSIIKCPTCYKPISSQVEFCPNCGTSIAKASVVTAATGNRSSSTVDVGGAKEEPYEQPAASADIQRLLKSERPLWKKVIVSILSVALVGFSSWVLLQFFLSQAGN